MSKPFSSQVVIAITLFFIQLSTIAQEDTITAFHPQLRGAIMMANSHVPKGTEGQSLGIIVPSWGFDIDYFFHPKWSAALQGDIKIASFEVEEENIVLNRSFPVCLVPVIHYHALRHWSFYTGLGYEIESHENLYLWRLGTEYSFEINENFEIALNLIFENKQEVYDTWTFGIAFNKKLWKRR